MIRGENDDEDRIRELHRNAQFRKSIEDLAAFVALLVLMGLAVVFVWALAPEIERMVGK